MLEKSHGAVACAHCQTRATGATACPRCARPICPRCAAADTCALPRARRIELPQRATLQALDPAGRTAVLARRSAPALLYDFEVAEAIASLPTTHSGKIVQIRGPVALDARWIVFHAVTYARSDARAPELWDAFIMSVEREGSQGVGPLISLPASGLTVQFLELAGDRRRVVAGGDDRFWVVDLEGREAVAPFTVGKQIAHSLAVSARHDLIAVGLFGKVACFRLSSRAPLGLIQVDDGNVTHLSIGGDRLVAITEDEVTSILELGEGPPATWPQRRLARFSCRGFVAQREGSRPHDGSDRAELRLCPGARAAGAERVAERLRVRATEALVQASREGFELPEAEGRT